MGPRGEGKFQRISWEEALETIGNELNRIKQTYGPSAIFHFTSAGSQALLNCGGPGPGGPIQRLLQKFGGCTSSWGGPSAQGSWFASVVTLGTSICESTHDNFIKSRLIILWGFNPAETRHSTNLMLALTMAKEQGTPIICVDPRYTDTAAALASEWIPIRPGTDSAFLIAMAYVILKENRQQARFLDTFTIGFAQFREYVLGIEDGIPKTSSWAESITGVPAALIERLAREYATRRPAALMAGYAPGRSAFGEQYHRAAITLAAMTGNVGILGGGAGGNLRGPLGSSFVNLPIGENPAERERPWPSRTLDSSLRSRTRVFLTDIFDAMLRGKDGGYPADIKLAYITMADPLNQLLNTNKGVKAFQKPEFIVVNEQFMTPTARFADILLPVTTSMERDDIIRPWLQGAYYIYLQKAIKPLGECKSDFEIATLLAKRLGIEDYSDKSEDEWLRHIVSLDPQMSALSENYERFKQKGIYKFQPSKPLVAFKEQIDDPEGHPFRTPSGKIEIYSQSLAALGNPMLPPIPKYIQTWESVNDSLAQRYPLQLITVHSKARVNSTSHNVPWLREMEPHTIWINSQDANKRSITDGDSVIVFNDRGQMTSRAKVTERTVPGVVSVGEGYWYQPDDQGQDKGGCVNVLTKDEHSPGDAFPSNTCLVEVKMLEK